MHINIDAMYLELICFLGLWAAVAQQRMSRSREPMFESPLLPFGSFQGHFYSLHDESDE